MKTTFLFFILIVVLAISFTEASNCPDSGFYPDPSNCRGYTLCYKDPTSRSGVLIGIDMKCPAGMAFDRDGGYCSRQASSLFC